jgi:metal-responsive CopG/Arc/MetJ family transcriptional regulator
LVSVTISLKRDTYDKLREYCKKHGVSESKMIARMIELYLEELDKRAVVKSPSGGG